MKKRFCFILTCLVLTFLFCQTIVGEAVIGERILYWGTTGEDVKTLQQKLKNWGYYEGNIDGSFGAQTYEAVRYFQRTNGLTVDGTVGPEVFRALGVNYVGANNNVANANASANSNDVQLLAKAVYGEARGEPYTGQVAVAAVILNRVESTLFPNTVSGVIFEPLAFTAVSDGQFYMTPNQQAYNAARDALNGWDPTGGALYYFNPSTATSAWIWSRPHIVTIGKHRFLK